MSAPWERAAASVGGPEVVEALGQLSASELTALLVEVSARRQRGIAPAEVARRYAEDRFVAPCPVDQRRIAALDAHLLARIPSEFEAIELAPVAPLGTCSALAPVHPNQVVPTFRGSEVVADCTNVLALECARRRASSATVRLCTSHRLLRTARNENPLFTQHFRVLTLVTAGRDPGGRSFAFESLSEQLGIWLRLLADLPEGLWAEPTELRLAWDDAHAEVVERLRTVLPIPIRRDEERLGRSAYYQGLAYKLYARSRSDAVIELGDGGLVDWVGRLRSDRKERLLIGALGTERLIGAFGSPG